MLARNDSNSLDEEMLSDLLGSQRPLPRYLKLMNSVVRSSLQLCEGFWPSLQRSSYSRSP